SAYMYAHLVLLHQCLKLTMWTVFQHALPLYTVLTPSDAHHINHCASLFPFSTNPNPGSLLSEGLFQHATPVCRNPGVRLRWTRCRIACLLQFPRARPGPRAYPKGKSLSLSLALY